MTNMVISKEFKFEASHILPLHKGKCSRLHGHSWVLTIAAQGPVHPVTGFVCDYGELKALVDIEIIEKLDHSHLGFDSADTNSGKPWTPAFGTGFYPSSENLARAIGKMLVPLIAELGKDIKLYEVKLNETCTSCATWRPGDE